jgi:alpha-beta hydrolase superfamily lysophospholipase
MGSVRSGPLRALLGLAAALLLAACTGGAPGSPLPAPVPAGAPSARLALNAWPSAGPPRAVILALHGFGDAGELAFESAAPYWASRGIAVYAPDQRGFGANADRKRWPGVDALVGDAVALSRALRQRHPGVPLVVVGESMGGGVALAAAGAGLDADALVLSAPAIAGGEALSPLARAVARTVATVVPDRRWTGGRLIEIRPTDNAAALARAATDPRSYHDASGRELYGLVLLMDRAAATAPAVRIPTLTLVGVHDRLIPRDPVRRVHDRVPGRTGFIAYPSGWHWLFRDLGGAAVWRDVADFALALDKPAPR